MRIAIGLVPERAVFVCKPTVVSGAQQAGEEPGEPLQRGLQRAHGAHWSIRHLVKNSGEVRMLPCHP